MSGVGLLLLLPGLIGGGLAGLLAGRRGALCGTVAALLFGATISRSRCSSRRASATSWPPYDVFVYPGLVGGLGLGGALGGLLGSRRRCSAPRSAAPSSPRR